MTEYFKRFTMDKDEVTVIDFMEGGVFECKYSDEAKSLCNVLNDLDYEKSNLKQENRQLKQQFNYIQNSISEHIKHQKTKLGQKALQEIIEDYNEWLLGHKRLQE